jgi:four helix bundle protein
MRNPDDLSDRLLHFADRVLELSTLLPERNYAASHVRRQLVRSCTSIAANHEEARGAQSRQDFVHKLSLALKEARETRFWLRLVALRGWAQEDELVDFLLDEAYQVVAIFVASVRTASGAEEPRAERAGRKNEA